MNIMINTLPVTDSKSGIKTYLLGLISGLVVQNGVSNIILLCSVSNVDLFEKYRDFDRVSLKIIPFKIDSPFSRIFFEQIILPFFIFKKSLVLINTLNVAVLLHRGKQVTVVQSPYAVKSCREAAKQALPSTFYHRAYYDLMLRPTLQRSSAVVAVSKSIKEFINVDNEDISDKVSVIYEGVDIEKFRRREFVPVDLNDTVKLLCVGTLFEYKNVDKAIDIVHAIRYLHPLLYDKLQLTIVGRDPSNGHSTSLMRKSAELGLMNKIKFVGPVDHEHVCDYYEKSDLLFFLSSVETFGLPLLEAFAIGVPVVCSNSMSVPEIAGDAGVVVDVSDIREAAVKTVELLTNKPYQYDLYQRAQRRTGKFTWNACANQFSELVAGVS